MATEEKEGTVQNMFDQAVAPIDFRKTEIVMASVEYVAFEVLSDYLLRWLFKLKRNPFVQTAVMHAVSIPFVGGASAFFNGIHTLGYEAPWGDVIFDGAKGTPALWAAQFVVQTSLTGFHFPKVEFKDLAVLLASKALSRVIIAGAWSYLPDQVRDSLDLLENAFQKQWAASRFKSDSD